MLDVGRAGRRNGREKRGVALGDEAGELRRDRVREALCDLLCVELVRSPRGLGLPGGGGEDEIGVGQDGVHGEPPVFSL